MPEITSCTENIVIPALGIGILFSGERLQYPPEYPLEYMVKYLSVCLQLLIQPLLRNIAVHDCNRQESDHYDGVR